MNELINMSNKSRLDLFFTPAGVDDGVLKDCRVVVIDVLRASTSITMALSNGAHDVFVAASVSGASELAVHLARKDVLLCGERDGKMVEGFNIGNSPSDYTRERVRGRTLIFGTTNGTPALVKASHAREVYVCGFVNIDSVIRTLCQDGDTSPIAILCAGNKNRFAMEDAVCGGLLVEGIRSFSGGSFTYNDAAQSAMLISRNVGDDLSYFLTQVDHGRYLVEIGMGDDLAICASLDSIPTVPVMKDGKLVKSDISID